MAKSFGTRISAFIRRRWLPLLIVGGVVLVAVLFMNGARAGRAETVANLQTVPLERGNLTATIGATGRVRALHSATLVWGTSGQVDFVDVSVGDTVAADQVLASLAVSSLPQNVIQAYAELQNAENALALEIASTATDLAEAQTALEDAQSFLYNLSNPGRAVDIDQAFANMVLAANQLERAQDAYAPYANKPDDNLVRANFLLRLTEAQKIYDAAMRTYNAYSGSANSTDIAVAQGQLTLAQGQLAVAQSNYDLAVKAADPASTSPAEANLAAVQATIKAGAITAPFSGVVTDILPTAGDMVTVGEVAIQLDDLSRLLVDVEVSEIDINRVQVGQAAVVFFDATPEREYRGIVSNVAISGSVSSGVVNFRVTVELETPDELVRPSMTAAVNIVVTELADVLLVPNRAVRVLEGQRVVYVMRAGQMVPVHIQLGASSETYSELVSGDLNEGDIIVLNPPAIIDFSPPSGGGFILRGGS